MIPGMYLTEGGQTASGALVDHVIETHPAVESVRALATERGHANVFEVLVELLEEQRQRRGLDHVCQLTAELHLLPDFLGNRSPLADPSSRGAVFGLTLRQDADHLALLYLATVQAIAYGTRHILEHIEAERTFAHDRKEHSRRQQNNKQQNEREQAPEQKRQHQLRRHRVDVLIMCGGNAQSSLYCQQHADATGCEIVLPAELDAVLVGAAVLAAVAGGAYGSVSEAMRAMNHAGSRVCPQRASAVRAFHDAKYQVFLGMHAAQRKYRTLMRSALPSL
jgi:D-ribulokinase